MANNSNLLQDQHDNLQAKACFWELHVKKLKHSGLSVKSYCKQHNLECSTFNYWVYKRYKKSSLTLIPIKIKEPPESRTKILCTVGLQHGGELRVYDVSVLETILNRML